MKNIVEWFDITNPKHIRAYNKLMQTGAWDKGFIPEGMEFPPVWQVRLAGMMADAYVKEKLEKWGDGTLDDLFVVRLYDGFDHEWMDISKPVPKEEAQRIWEEHTEGGKKHVKYDDIDYYAIFPADTIMMYSAERIYKNRGKNDS